MIPGPRASLAAPLATLARAGIGSAALLLLAAAPLTAQADAHLGYVDDQGNESPILIRGDTVRMDLTEANSGTRGFMLFDATSGTLTVVDDDREHYVELTPEAMDQQIRAMTDTVSDLRQQMQQLPPEMREQLERDLGLTPEGFEAEISTRPTGETEEIAGYACEANEVYVGEQPRSSVCVAPPEELGLAADDFATLSALMDRLHELSLRALEAGGPLTEQLGGSMLPRVDGVPLEVREHDGITTQLTEVDTATLEASLFRIPEGYARQALPENPPGPENVN